MGFAKKRIFLFLDFDGTLAPIALTPAQARIRPALRRLLRRVARRRDARVAVVSGRALKDIKRLVGIPGIVYAGNHGMDIQGPGIRFVEPAAMCARPLLVKISARLKKALKEFPGAAVENKGLTLSVHYRLVRPGDVRAVLRTIQNVLGPAIQSGCVRLTTGKKVVEVRPFTHWDKGRALGMILEHAQKASCLRFLPVCVGDDRTDEAGFKAASLAGGFGVFVGARNVSNRARYHVRSPRALEVWLRRFFDAGQ